MSLSVTQPPQAQIPQMDSTFIVPMFQQGEDSIECINKAMAFLFAVASRFSLSNNQLRMSSNPRNQATIQDGRVTVQQVQGRQNQSFARNRNRGKGHMVRQCTQPKRLKNTAWFKEKLMLAEAKEAGQILDEEQLAFLADPGTNEVPIAQQTIPHNSAFQTEDLDAYDSDCDDLSSAKAVLMANLSSCDSDVLSEVPYFDSYPNDMLNQDVQEMLYSEQTYIDDFPDNKIHSDSNIIPYSQYLQESQNAEITGHTRTRIQRSGASLLRRIWTSDHNSSELGIHDHSNEPSSSKLVPKVVPPAVKTATSRQELELLFHNHITMLRTLRICLDCEVPLSWNPVRIVDYISPLNSLANFTNLVFCRLLL
ncbi:hypothetical protein Tco_0852024 [Tanacetum coccineum]